jgi:hypothetical protein
MKPNLPHRAAAEFTGTVFDIAGEGKMITLAMESEPGTAVPVSSNNLPVPKYLDKNPVTIVPGSDLIIDNDRAVREIRQNLTLPPVNDRNA